MCGVRARRRASENAEGPRTKENWSSVRPLKSDAAGFQLTSGRTLGRAMRILGEGRIGGSGSKMGRAALVFCNLAGVEGTLNTTPGYRACWLV